KWRVANSGRGFYSPLLAIRYALFAAYPGCARRQVPSCFAPNPWLGRFQSGSAGGPIVGESAVDNGPPRASAPDEAPLKLEEFLPYRLNVLANLVSQALSRIYVERYGLGVPEWRVLVTLGEFGVMTGKAVGAHSHMHKTKVSRAVAELEK